MLGCKSFGGLLAIVPLLAFGDMVGLDEAFTMNSSVLAECVSAVEDLDCRVVFPVMRLDDEPALQNLAYSAIGWEVDAAADLSRTVTVTAQFGEYNSRGEFVVDSSVGVSTVLPETTGRGYFNCDLGSAVKKVCLCLCRLTHTVKENGQIVETETLLGYFDLSRCTILPKDAKREGELLLASDSADAACQVWTDLQMGVRTPKRLSDVHPFEYSSTNWIGDVVGVSAESVACVTICPLQGTDDDVTTWEEVSDKKETLVDEVGEGQIKWNPHKGVWKATFDILNEDKSIHYEDVFFDLRNAQGPGLAIILK